MPTYALRAEHLQHVTITSWLNCRFSL